MILKEIRRGETGTGILIEQDGFLSIEHPTNKILKETIDKGMEEDGWHIPHPFTLTAVLQKANVENGNGRIYPRHVLEAAVEKYSVFCSERRGYGETNHPSDIVIDLKNIPFIITRLWWDGDTVMGEMELLLSPGYIKHGVISSPGDLIANHIWFNRIKIGISSRGVGSLEQRHGKVIVGDDFELFCWDLVNVPSTPGAWVDRDPDNLKQYVESVEVLNNKDFILEKLNKLTNSKSILL